MFSPGCSLIVFASCASLALSQQIASDPGRGGMPIEIVHLYNDEFPQGEFSR